MWAKMVKKHPAPPDEEADDPRWENALVMLRKRWSEVPTDVERVRTPRLQELSDSELIHWWEDTRNNAITGEYFFRRGWYHLLYAPLIKNASLIDFGSGLGLDGLSFAPGAARVTFVDIAPGNLELLGRVAKLQKLTNVDFLYLESFESLNALEDGYDVILASGSLHHAPESVMRREIQLLAPHLKIGGRWLQLAYPKRRWERDGRLPFSDWGKATDGERTPWAEWYDLEKLLKMFEPLRFDAVLAFNYHNDDFNWFDLVRRT